MMVDVHAGADAPPEAPPPPETPPPPGTSPADEPGARLQRLLLGYIPILATFVAIALFVAIVPSRAPGEVSSIGGFDPDSGSFGGSSGAPGSGVGTGSASGQSQGPGGGPGGSRSGRPGGGANSSEGFIGQISDTFGQAPPGFDCSRNALFDGPTCRPPAWTGTDNGGRTSRGVTKDAINIVLYVPARNQQVDTLLAAAGTPSEAQRRETGERYTVAFNKHFELYGRKLNYTGIFGPNQANDPQGQIADAQHVANELDAFLVITASASEPFYTELARLGVPSYNLTDQFPQAYMAKNAPHIWSVLPDLDLTLDHLSEYFCKRVAGKNAIWAGDPLLQGSRKLGILYPDTSDAGPRLIGKIRAACGIEIDPDGVIQYASDIAQAQQTATNAILQLSTSGVNIVACLCDPIAPVFFTSEATKQGYLPEWLQNGIFVTDAPAAGRLYDQSQWGRSWGISVLSPYQLLRDQARWHVYFEGGGTDCESAARATSNYYQQFMYAVSAMEAVGPNLNVRRWAEAMFAMPVRGGTGTVNRYSFGSAGPGPFSQIDNAMEHWWEPEANGPDGRPGYSFYVQSGFRYNLGTWPAGDANMFVDDGSTQVRNDPDAC